jgi:hypothetical protein
MREPMRYIDAVTLLRRSAGNVNRRRRIKKLRSRSEARRRESA